MSGSTTTVLLWTGLALYVLGNDLTFGTSLALGLSYTVVHALALCMAKEAVGAEDRNNTRYGRASSPTARGAAHGTAATRGLQQGHGHWPIVCRDVSLTAAVAMWSVCLLSGQSRSASTVLWHEMRQVISGQQDGRRTRLIDVTSLGIIFVQSIANFTILITVSSKPRAMQAASSDHHIPRDSPRHHHFYNIKFALVSVHHNHS